MKHVIFDFDGTLVDSMPVAMDILQEIHPKFHITDKELAMLKNMSSREILKYSGIPYWRLPRLLLKGKKILSQRLDQLKVFKGMPETVRALHKAGYELSVVSSNSEEIIRNILKREEIEYCFAGIYGNVGLFNKARVFKVVQRDQQSSPDKTIYVGDETRDIEAAHKSGIPIVSVTWGYNGEKILSSYKPEYLAHTPKELLNILLSNAE
jgi:phosphoglycolate phosphatase-like HAD superfamily hydrolase